MRENSGRIEKRIVVSLPIEVASLQDPASSERTLTENVSPLGVRALLRRARDRNERVIVTSLASNEQAPARVVYCQRLSGGGFAVGLEFQGTFPEWPQGAAD